MQDVPARVWEHLLSGSTATDARRIAELALEEPEAIQTISLAALQTEGNVRALAFSALKLIAEIDPSFLDNCRETILCSPKSNDPWTVPLLAAQAAARMSWPQAWHGRVRTAFEPRLQDKNKFVRAWALRALWPVVEPGSVFHQRLLKTCDQFLGEGGALAASARIVLGRPRGHSY